MEKPANQVMVIFGASGDLTYRKLIPAIYVLYKQQMLPESFRVLGIGRTEMSDEHFREKMADGIRKFSEFDPLDEQLVNKFTGLLSYHSMNITSPDEYVRLKSFLERMHTSGFTERNYLFYLSLVPEMFGLIAKNLSKAGFSDPSDGFKRLIVEKPFGYDLESALALNRDLHEAFNENQLYRIDHYLGKETVQNLLVMRFSNGIFEPLWNRNYIHHMEITSAESIGVESRGRYYEGSGALRDMLQNHLLQMVGFAAMEPPISMDADAIRNETFKVFQSLRPIQEGDVPSQVIRGQYTDSHVRGQSIPGYREEKNVDPDSRTETYVAMKFFIDNWRWGGVPFYIRTGKRLPTRVTEIVAHFKSAPQALFKDNQPDTGYNQLIIRIQPDEGILIKFGMKQPGAGFNVKNVNMDFHYSELSDLHLPSAYERLLYDAMMGDSTLYARADTVEAAWRFVAPIQKVWASNQNLKVYGYPAGTWGPEHADDLIEDCRDGWRYPCKNLADDGMYCEL
ncbi:MAG: glucose-6-phosphate dehydrogenase [Bacteroidales bacterium]|nr:glucose-6-phosphate dehydrogenase [Bacteroidales bacterium]